MSGEDFNLTGCAEDQDCPGPLLCFEDVLGAGTLCDCPAFSGFVNASSGCVERGPQFYLYVVPSTIFIVLITVCLLFYAWIFYKWFIYKKLPKLSPTLRILGFSLLTSLLTLLQCILGIWAIFHLDDWVIAEGANTRLGDEKQDIKVFPIFQISVFCSIAATITGVFAITETGLLWVEITYSAKNMQNFSSFRKARLISGIIEFGLILVAGAAMLFTQEFLILIYGYVGIPILIISLVVVLYGRVFMLRTLQHKSKLDTDNSLSAGVVSSSEALMRKFRRIRNSIHFLSIALFLTLSVYLVGFIFLFLSGIVDFRDGKLRGVELSAIGAFIVDTAIVFELIWLFWYTFDAINIIGSRGSLSRVGDDSKSLMKQGSGASNTLVTSKAGENELNIEL